MGDLVLVRLSDHERSAFPCRKLAPRWSEIRTVQGRLSNGVTYRVARADGHTESVHVSRLLPLRDPVWNSVDPDSRGTPLTKAAQETSPRFTAAQDYSPREAQEGPATEGETTMTTITRKAPNAPVVYDVDDGPTQDTPPTEAAQEDLPRTYAAQGGDPRGAQEESRDELVPVPTPSGAEPPPGFFPVERIVGRKNDPVRGYLYRVRWQGYGPRDDTWQARDDFPTPLLIDEYEQAVREKRSPRGGDVVAAGSSQRI